MGVKWADVREEWLKKSLLPPGVSAWAVETINKAQVEISALEVFNAQSLTNPEERVSEQLKFTRKRIKNELTKAENELDDLTLNTPNSYKLQVSIHSNLNYQMKAWSAAEGRDLSSVALQCMETGLREIKGRGGLPDAAVQRYDLACEKRIALAEINDLWEKNKRGLPYE